MSRYNAINFRAYGKLYQTGQAYPDIGTVGDSPSWLLTEMYLYTEVVPARASRS
jgi:hypothetical protein